MLRDRVSASTIDAPYDRISPAVEGATLRTIDRSVPSPRRDPFQGRDRIDSPDWGLMERLTDSAVVPLFARRPSV